MKIQGIRKALSIASKTLGKHSPSILTGVAVGSLVVSVVFAVIGTSEAKDVIEEVKETEEKETLTKLEVVQHTWKYYIPTVGFVVLSATSAILAQRINSKRIAVLASALVIAQDKLKDQTEKIEELFGKAKADKLSQALSQDQVNKNPPEKGLVYETGKGITLCMDSLTGQYFRSDPERIRQDINEINKELLHTGYVSLNDVLDQIGLRQSQIGLGLGWDLTNSEDLIEISFDSTLTSTNEPCLVMLFRTLPSSKYRYS